MKRKSKKTIPVHVTIPVRLLEDLDETLSYKQSRSKVISILIENYLEGDQVSIGSMTRKQILVALINQVEPGSGEDYVLRSLLDVFSE